MFTTHSYSKQQNGSATNKATSPHFPLLHTTNSSLVSESLALANMATRTLIQPKLKIGAPNDKYEQEADRVAEQVMRMPGPGMVQTQQSPPRIQRLCPECEDELHRQPEEEEEEELVQASAGAGRTEQPNSGIASELQGLKGGGQAMYSVTRSFMEPRFGRDFSQVRIHADGRAARLAQSIKARAFTMGQNVVFGSGQYRPYSADGQRLMAHELTHVVQQGNDANPVAASTVQRSCADGGCDMSGWACGFVGHGVLSPPCHAEDHEALAYYDKWGQAYS